MSLPILLAPALRAIETRHAKVRPPLMERAGQAAAEITQEMLTGTSGPPLIVAGPGNNGGDAFVVARLLKASGHSPSVLFWGAADKLPADARQAYQAWIAAGGTCLKAYPKRAVGLIIDGLFGIGLKRAITGTTAAWIERINACGTPILALDVPSGLDAETGLALGPVVRATRTATFIALKPGLLMGDGPDCCGEISLCDLDIMIEKNKGELVSPSLFQEQLRPRRSNSHKGSFGNVAIIGGASGMAGAALLAGRAALKLGAGRVYVGMLDPMAADFGQPELMLRPPADALSGATVIAIGPGLGQSDTALKLMTQAIDMALPLVVDADGLNLLAKNPRLQRKLAVLPAPTFITPHPVEAARLLGMTTAEVQADRITAASTLSRRLRTHVALKGCGTVIATPAGNWYINASGNPGLASAGSGDVLTGMLAALLAQDWPPPAALLAAVHLHGAAADACVARGQGPVGLTAGELIDSARSLLNHWIDG